MERPSPTPEPGGSIFAAIALLVVGLVVFVPSGLCTGTFFFGPIVQAVEHPAQGTNFFLSGVALVVGGPFVLGGFAMIRSGAKTLIAYFGNRR
jgi:hypothetical protein